MLEAGPRSFLCKLLKGSRINQSICITCYVFVHTSTLWPCFPNVLNQKVMQLHNATTPGCHGSGAAVARMQSRCERGWICVLFFFLKSSNSVLADQIRTPVNHCRNVQRNMAQTLYCIWPLMVDVCYNCSSSV